MDTEVLKKMAYMALGYVTMSPEKAKALTQQLTETGKVSEEEGHALVNEMMAKFKVAGVDVEKQIEKITKGVSERLNIVQAKKLDELSKRLLALESKGVKKGIKKVKKGIKKAKKAVAGTGSKLKKAAATKRVKAARKSKKAK